LINKKKHKVEIEYRDETDDVKIKGSKFYTMNYGRSVIRQFALGRTFKGMSVKKY